MSLFRQIFSSVFRKPQIPESTIDYCNVEISKLNQVRFQYIAPLVIVADIIIVGIYLYNAINTGLNNILFLYIIANTIFMLILSGCYIFWKFLRFTSEKQFKVILVITFSSSMVWTAVLSILDHNVTTYIMALLIFSIAFRIRPRVFLSVQFFVMLPLLVLPVILKIENMMVIQDYINAILCLFLSVYMSHILYKSAMESFAHEKIIETESKISHDALERFEIVWANVECGITLIDSQTRQIIDINPVVMRMFGGKRADIIGRRCHKFICSAEDCACPVIDDNQDIDRSEQKFITASGKVIPIIKSVSKIYYNDKLYLLESFTDITDLKEAEERLRLMSVTEKANQAKSDFLSRMSHEMRTPMNAIIGMTKIAENSGDISRLKYCLSTIRTSSTHLLEIINDILDMSKIEAGKFELENVPMNIEKMLMKVCNLIIDSTEKKKQKLSVILGKNLNLNYIADDLRLSQVVINLLSNAVKFTPENGKITLMVEQTGQHENTRTLRFTINDTGIGMNPEQIARLFNAFEQADGGISRKYGGTGLGLAISKSIIEKMGGRIWVESEQGCGSKFIFEVNLEYAPHQDTVIFDGIRPGDLKLLVIENDDDVRKQFLSITEEFGIKTDTAADAAEAINLIETALIKNSAYDIIFLDYAASDSNSQEIISQLSSRIDKNTVIVITTFLEWQRIEHNALGNNIAQYITKPLFPSSILNAINNVIGSTLKALDIKTDAASEAADSGNTDLSGVRIILAEDVEINREIFAALMEETHISIDVAENGLVAVSKFKENPEKYDLIIMDIQMPEMDGYQATQIIRALDIPRAKTIPIIAMTANAFKEDVDRCFEYGMNDHLPKPIDEKTVIEKIVRYSVGRG